MHATRSQPIPPERHQALMQLLPLIGPYRREQLRLRLLSAARACRDEANSLRRSKDAFSDLTGVPLTELPLAPKSVPSTPHGWEAEASVFEQLADITGGYRSPYATTH